jgi:DNA-binding transcriptional regulator LsrR (DeoR family)
VRRSGDAADDAEGAGRLLLAAAVRGGFVTSLVTHGATARALLGP